MVQYSTIDLQDSGFFSALAYAPPAVNAILWGLSQTGVNLESAQALSASHWTDQTQSLMKQFLPGQTFYSKDFLNSFRVFVNSISGEVVFAFKGSDSITNFASDLSTIDQGFSQYDPIRAAADSLYSAMKANPQYGSYQYFADGHSLGGSMAQTFALEKTISGFGQNSLPIAPTSITKYWPTNFSTVAGAYDASTTVSFQNVALQGDAATALYSSFYQGTGSFYLGTTRWLINNPGLILGAVESIASSTNTVLASANAPAAAGCVVAVSALLNHRLAALIPAALAQLPAGTVTAPLGNDIPGIESIISGALQPFLSTLDKLDVTFNSDGTINLPSVFAGAKHKRITITIHRANRSEVNRQVR